MPSVGSNSPQAKNAGSWKGWSRLHAKHAGVWKKPLGVYAKRSGSWVKVWDERPSITNLSLNHVTYIGEAPEPTYTLYYKNFTVNANGFQTNLTVSPNDGSVSISQTVVNAETSVYVTTETFALGFYDPIYFPTITATNTSGAVSF